MSGEVCSGIAKEQLTYRTSWHAGYGPGSMSVSTSDLIVAALLDRDYGNDLTQGLQYLVESFMRPFFTVGLSPTALPLLFRTALAIHLANDDLISTAPVSFATSANTSPDIYFLSPDLPAFTKYYATFGRE